MVRPMVHSTKHIVQFTIRTVVAAGPQLQHLSIVSAVATPNKDDPDEVEEGSTVKACYVELWIRAADTTGGSGQLVLYKKSSGQGTPSIVNMAALHDWNNKKNILFTQMGLFNDQDADAVAVMRGWYKIPKGKQRFGLGDELQITVFTPSIDLHICGFAIYKEYS